jgi:hypothetical protein
MSRNALRVIILITGLFTAVVHLVALNLLLGKIDPLFTLNGLGYLGLLGAFFLDLPFLAERRRLVHLAFIAFAAVTIVAWFALGDFQDVLGIVTKIDEAILILALFMHMRSSA